MDTKLIWHSFEERQGGAAHNLFCVEAEDKDAAVLMLYARYGLIYDRYIHNYNAFANVDALTLRFFLQPSGWNDAINRAKQDPNNYSVYIDLSLKVHIMLRNVEEHKTIEYGANCSKCSELFPYAIKTENFKCWKCNHGY